MRAAVQNGHLQEVVDFLRSPEKFQRLGAQAASHDEDAQRSLAIPESALRKRKGGNFGTHRVPRPLGALERVRKTRHRLVSDIRKHPVREPCDGILLMQGERAVEKRRHHAPWKRDIASKTEDHIRPDAPDVPRAFPERAVRPPR